MVWCVAFVWQRVEWHVAILGMMVAMILCLRVGMIRLGARCATGQGPDGHRVRPGC